MCDEASVTLNNIYINTYIYIYMGWVELGWVKVTPGVTLNNITPLNIFLIGCKF